MKSIAKRFFILMMSILFIAGCSSGPVKLERNISGAGTVDFDHGRVIDSSACGFQLLLFIPIQVNSRFQRAYNDLLQKAGNDFIDEIQIKESWWYGFVGTVYCTHLQANAFPVK